MMKNDAHPDWPRVLTLTCVFLAPGLAQTSLDLAGAVGQALDSHPLLAAQSQRVAVAGGLITQAGLRPNPRIYLQSENWGLNGAAWLSNTIHSDQFAYFTQPFETGGKRERRVELSRENVHLAELEKELLAKQISWRVKQAYWAAAGAERIRQLWAEQQNNFRQTIEYHEVRVREGAIAESELLRVRLEAERFAVEASAAALEADRAKIELLREMGSPAMPEFTLATPLDLGSAPPSADIAPALENRTEVKLARQEIARAEANTKLQRANAHPDIEAGGGYKRNVGYNTLLLTATWNFALFNKNQGNISAAVSEERVAQSTLAAAQARVRAEVLSAQHDVEGKRHQLQDLLAGTLARAAQSAEIANAAYREGGADLLRLLDAQRIRIDLEVLYAKTLMQYRQSVATLEAAMGVNP